MYYDGLVLTNDKNNLSGMPYFNNAIGDSGSWQGEEFTNLLRNGSAETAGIRIRSGFDSIITRFLPARASLLVTSILDPSGAGWMFQASGLRIFRTFWGKFGWGHIPLIGSKPYRVIGGITILGILGFCFWLLKGLHQKKLQMYANYILVFMVLMVIVWFGVITRGTPHLGVIQMYLPVARYAAPAIIPTLLVLSIGWLEILRNIIMWLRVRSDIREPVCFVVYFGAFVLFDIYGVLSIYQYYFGG